MNKKIGLISNRGAGSIKPSPALKEKESKTQLKPKKQSKGLKNQKHTIKLPDDIFNKLKIIKSINGIKFDYDVINLLIDSYVENAPKEDAEFYRYMTNKMK